jgi:hypothetical protein
LSVAAWKLPLLVIAIILPIVVAFALGGGGVGLGAGALVAAVIVAAAVRQRPWQPIVPPQSPDARRHVLIVVSRPVEDPAAVRRIVGDADLEGGREEAEVLVLAPVRIGFLDRWASDLEGARRRAQRNLVVTVASLARADVAAEARVGDEDLVQAVEDQLRTFPASEVILASGGPEEDGPGVAAASELESRLQVPFQHIVVEGSRPA